MVSSPTSILVRHPGVSSLDWIKEGPGGPVQTSRGSEWVRAGRPRTPKERGDITCPRPCGLRRTSHYLASMLLSTSLL